MPTGDPATSVLVPDLHNPFWVRLRNTLDDLSDFEVRSAPARGGHRADDRPSAAPEVVLLESGCRFRCVGEMLREWTSGRIESPKVLLIADERSPESVPPCLGDVHGVLSKEQTSQEVAAAIRMVAGGYLLSANATTGASQARRDDGEFSVDREAVRNLSDRELDVLRLIATGYGNTEISRELFLSTSTVKSHLQRLFGKLGIKNRTQAVVCAYESGIAEPVAH